MCGDSHRSSPVGCKAAGRSFHSGGLEPPTSTRETPRPRNASSSRVFCSRSHGRVLLAGGPATASSDFRNGPCGFPSRWILSVHFVLAVSRRLPREDAGVGAPGEKRKKKVIRAPSVSSGGHADQSLSPSSRWRKGYHAGAYSLFSNAWRRTSGDIDLTSRGNRSTTSAHWRR